MFAFRILKISLFTLFSSCAFAQTDSLLIKHIDAAFEPYSAANPIEKVYLQTDNTNYYPTDTIWYKAYTVIGPQHRLSALSGVLYVELISPNDTVITRQLLHLTAGVAWGDFPLSFKIKPGDYHIRAYTNWMRNAGPEYFFNKTIHVGDDDTTPLAKKKAGVNPDVQFFPEGGEMVNGLRSKIAVKSIAPNGLGQNISGLVMDNEGNLVANFATGHLGMGVFAFTPQSGKTYKARIKTGIDETTFDVNLAKSNEAGFTLSLNNTQSDSIYLKIAANAVLFEQQQHRTFNVIAQSAGKIYYTARIALENLVFSAGIDKKRFPSGIVQFTLFTNDGEPLNERSAFIQGNDTLQLSINNSVKTFAPGQKVSLGIEVKNHAAEPVVGAFSAAVTNESMSSDDEVSESNIFETLLLTSDLKGYVEKPGYYFTNANDQTRADLDMLLLTQGYQRFEWKSILQNKVIQPTFSAQTALRLTGNIKTLSGKPVPHANVSFLAAKEMFIADTLADADGNFVFENFYLPDSAKVLLHAKTTKNNNNINISVDGQNYPAIIKQIHGSALDSVSTAQLQTTKPDSIKKRTQQASNLRNSRMLREVTIKAHKYYKRETPDLSNSDNLNGPGAADQVIMENELKGCVNLADCLPGTIRGVEIINGIPRNLRALSPAGPAPMVLIIDGAISNETKLEDINPNTIHSIEVLKSKSYLGVYGGRAGGGALVITTKRAGDKSYFNSDAMPGTLEYTINGFYKAHEFYTPKYKNLQDKAIATDMRSTIYWNPDIITDSDGKASFDFYNGGTKGTYRVVIEGINDDGDLGRLVYRYKVE